MKQIIESLLLASFMLCFTFGVPLILYILFDQNNLKDYGVLNILITFETFWVLLWLAFTVIMIFKHNKFDV